jgi:(2Fe-2S) ferredoxin
VEDLTQKVTTHLFVCCRQRDRKSCCASKGAAEWVDQLKSWVKTEGLKGQVKVSKSSCLGHCESGVTAVLYPQNQWLHKISEDDLTQIKKMIKKYAN